MKMIERIMLLDKSIAELEAKQKALIEEMIATESPHKIDDIVEVNGYAFEGQRMKVVKIGVGKDFSGRYKWSFIGNVLKKDGTPGLYEGVRSELVKTEE